MSLIKWRDSHLSIDYTPQRSLSIEALLDLLERLKVKTVLSSVSKKLWGILAEGQERTLSPRTRQERAKNHMTKSSYSRILPSSNNHLFATSAACLSENSSPPPHNSWLYDSSATALRPLDVFGPNVKPWPLVIVDYNHGYWRKDIIRRWRSWRLSCTVGRSTFPYQLINPSLPSKKYIYIHCGVVPPVLRFEIKLQFHNCTHLRYSLLLYRYIPY